MSDKSVVERLQVRNGRRLAVIDAPVAVAEALGAEARADVTAAEVVLLFVADRVRLDAALPAALAALRPDAIFWLAYPKLTGRLAGDLNRDIIRGLAPAHGLDTVSQIAIDGDWSALRLKRVASDAN